MTSRLNLILMSWVVCSDGMLVCFGYFLDIALARGCMYCKQNVCAVNKREPFLQGNSCKLTGNHAHVIILTHNMGGRVRKLDCKPDIRWYEVIKTRNQKCRSAYTRRRWIIVAPDLRNGNNVVV